MEAFSSLKPGDHLNIWNIDLSDSSLLAILVAPRIDDDGTYTTEGNQFAVVNENGHPLLIEWREEIEIEGKSGCWMPVPSEVYDGYVVLTVDEMKGLQQQS